MKRIMKKVISFLIAISVFVCAMPVSALTSGSFVYEVVDGEAVITAYKGTATSVTIPATIGGYTVYGVGESAFKGNTKITSITVTTGVKDIGASAFENCTALATITLPNTIKHFGERAIYNTAYYNDRSNWKEKVGNTGETLPWEDIAAQNLDYLYLGKILVEASYSGRYSINYGTIVIADGAFAGSKAGQVTLASQTATIGNNAFKDCQKLSRISFSSNLEYIGKAAFENCTSLVDISLPDKDIQMYASAFYNTGYYNNPENWDGNILYHGTRVIGIKSDCTIAEIHDGATEIIGEALLNKDVIIPASVVKISEDAFTESKNVTIYGYVNSYAQEYATVHNIRFVPIYLKGDVNKDGSVTRADYDILCNVCQTREYETEHILTVGDMDEDGAVDAFDLIYLDLLLNDMPPSRLKGDADGDGDVDRDDYELLVAISQTRARVTDNVMFIRCDLNEDGAVDSFDALYLDLALNNIVALV